MKRRLPLLLSLLAFASLAARAEIGVWIDHPVQSDAVFGPVEIAVAVESQEPVTVEVFVDGKSVGIMARPPFKATYDFGYENVGHTIRVVARSRSGEEATASVTTRPIQIDEAIQVPLQQLYVTVAEGGRRLGGLQRDDFRVIDGGERQEIVTFEGGDVPLTVALVLDCSLSMRGERLKSALRGAGLFLEHMAPLDVAGLWLFSDRLLRRTEFSSDAEALRPALEDVEALGGTALNDHLFMALERLDTRQGRRVVVLFTDGSDVHSVLSMEQVLRKAQISQALIYWIHLQTDGETGPPRYTTAWRDVESNRQEYRLLQRAIQESGGRVRAVSALEELDDAFLEILDELRGQYVLGYYPTENRDDGSWREVKVRVRHPGAQVRAREGYLDY